ncbi:MAG: hypothetical protein JWM74_5129, partial [Myxococcaceae bacterium]|nr:hypothetical protein [Myxococcaceae bacterium]
MLAAWAIALAGSGVALAADPPKPAPRSPTAKATAPRYATYVRDWHATPTAPPPADQATGRPLLAVVSLNTRDRIEILPASDKGGFSARDLDRLSYVLRDSSNGNQHPIEPRLVDLVYRIQVHFHAPELRVISAYRTPRRGGTSNHGRGRAIDMIVPGTSDQELAKFAREQGFSGVGIYPTSGFVHVDVRERSYFWVDTSGPGKRSRIRGILADLAQKSDSQALARGERSVGPFLVGTDVNAVVGVAPAAP